MTFMLIAWVEELDSFQVFDVRRSICVLLARARIEHTAVMSCWELLGCGDDLLQSIDDSCSQGPAES